jgi:hypothetical protein
MENEKLLKECQFRKPARTRTSWMYLTEGDGTNRNERKKGFRLEEWGSLRMTLAYRRIKMRFQWFRSIGS